MANRVCGWCGGIMTKIQEATEANGMLELWRCEDCGYTETATSYAQSTSTVEG